MRSHLMLGTLFLVGACGGGSYIHTVTASPSAAPADVITCVRTKLGALGYQLTSYDQIENRVTARKTDNEAHRADPHFRRNADKLEIQATPAADGKTTLTATGRTFAELETHAGPREEEESPSEGVKQASQAILDACGQP